VSITTSVSGKTNVDQDRNFENDGYSVPLGRITPGFNLGNPIANDSDGDGFITEAHDMTLAFQNFTSLNAGQTVSYTATTLFGNVVPPSPGSSDVLPLLPSNIGPNCGFNGEVSADLFAIGKVWFDPAIATGNAYAMTGAEFASVRVPSLAVVNNRDGYILTVNGVDYLLAAGTALTLADDVTGLTITGLTITGLTITGIDPADFAAFATGLSLHDITQQTITFTQTPIQTTPTSVPLPAGVWLKVAGFASLRGRHGARKAAWLPRINTATVAGPFPAALCLGMEWCAKWKRRVLVFCLTLPQLAQARMERVPLRDGPQVSSPASTRSATNPLI
jgi:hypothetical protein